MYPNSALSVWQLTIMAVIPVALLFGWLIAIFVASREPGRQSLAAADSPEGPAVARISEHEPERPSADRMAA